ncbi:MAG: hypothetical protein OEZ06_32600, partial [Myxococcales bacterium]|nr:hypothetical protein [Myxococcales bacterium]
MLERTLALGLHVDAALEFDHTWLLLDFSAWSSEQVPLADGSWTLELDRWDVGVSACPLATFIGRLELDACPGLMPSGLHLQPQGFDGRALTLLMWSPRLTGRAAYWLGSALGLQAQLDLLRSFPQHRIDVVIPNVLPRKSARLRGCRARWGPGGFEDIGDDVGRKEECFGG